MEVINKINNEVLKISLIGELDASGAVNLDHVIKKALDDRYYKIVVDCQELDYISSAGLGVFISYLADITDNNGKLVFFNMKEKVRHVFDLLGLQNVITITGNYQEAKTVLYEN
jgi:anti-sigma B factor antagonist